LDILVAILQERRRAVNDMPSAIRRSRAKAAGSAYRHMRRSLAPISTGARAAAVAAAAGFAASQARAAK
jgi:hypothetical protein